MNFYVKAEAFCVDKLAFDVAIANEFTDTPLTTSEVMKNKDIRAKINKVAEHTNTKMYIEKYKLKTVFYANGC